MLSMELVPQKFVHTCDIKYRYIRSCSWALISQQMYMQTFNTIHTNDTLYQSKIHLHMSTNINFTQSNIYNIHMTEKQHLNYILLIKAHQQQNIIQLPTVLCMLLNKTSSTWVCILYSWMVVFPQETQAVRAQCFSTSK